MIKPFGFAFRATNEAGPGFSSVARGLGDIQRESQRTRDSLARVSSTLLQSRDRMSAYGRSTGQTRAIMTQFGQQAADTAVVLQMGQHPLQVFAQQGSQILAVFGPVGALLGGVAAVVGTLGLIAVKSGGDLSQLSAASGALAGVFSVLADSARVAGSYMIDAVNLVVNNLDRLMITASLVGGYFAVRWVGAMVAARIATMTMAGSLVALKAAIATTGIGLAVVAAGELIYRFVQLVQATGSVGKAFGLLKDIASEVCVRIGDLFMAASKTIAGAAWGMVGAFLRAFDSIAADAYKTAKGLADMFGQLPGIGAAFLAAQAGIAGVYSATRGAADEADRMASGYHNAAAGLYGLATEPLQSLGALSDVLGNVADTQVDIRDLFNGTGAAAEAAGGAAELAGREAQGAADNARGAWFEWYKQVHSVADSISREVGDGLLSIIDGTKSAADGFKDMARAIIRELLDVMVVQKIVANLSTMISGNGSTGGGLVGGLMSWAGIAPGRANGGPVQAGGVYRVNESSDNGNQEFFIPGQNGTVANNVNTGGAVNIVQNITVNAGVPEAVRLEMARSAPMLAKMSEDAVRRANGRGRQ